MLITGDFTSNSKSSGVVAKTLAASCSARACKDACCNCAIELQLQAAALLVGCNQLLLLQLGIQYSWTSCIFKLGSYSWEFFEMLGMKPELGALYGRGGGVWEDKTGRGASSLTGIRENNRW
jgi:hypothetical protein